MAIHPIGLTAKADSPASWGAVPHVLLWLAILQEQAAVKVKKTGRYGSGSCAVVYDV